MPPALAAVTFSATCLAYYGLNLYKTPPLTAASLLVYPSGPGARGKGACVQGLSLVAFNVWRWCCSPSLHVAACVCLCGWGGGDWPPTDSRQIPAIGFLAPQDVCREQYLDHAGDS